MDALYMHDLGIVKLAIALVGATTFVHWVTFLHLTIYEAHDHTDLGVCGPWRWPQLGFKELSQPDQ